MNKTLGTIIKFEVSRTLKKPSFWIITAFFPLIIIFGMVVSILGSEAIDSSSSIDNEDNQISFLYLDHKNIVNESIANKRGGTPLPEGQAIDEPQSLLSDEIAAVIEIPSQFPDENIVITAKDRGFISNDIYENIATDIIKQSALENVDDDWVISAISNNIPMSVDIYKDGTKSLGFKEFIAPGIFIILFYFSIVMLGGHMINATVEEKENRITEIILTTMNPSLLLFGKNISILIIGMVQTLFIIATMVLAAIITPLILGGDDGPFAGFSLESLSQLNIGGIPIDPVRTLLALGIFISAFLFVSGLLTLTGSMSSDAKQAGQIFGFVIVGLIMPYWVMTLLLSSPDHPLTQFLTWFPLTSPVTVLTRNAVQNMPVLQVVISLIVQTAVGVFFFLLGGRIFRYGAMSYQGMNLAGAKRAVLKG